MTTFPRMIVAAVLVIAAVYVFLPRPAWADDWPVDQMNEQIDQTNFVINRGCSGTLISVEKRYLLTAAHCVADQYETVEIEEVDPVTGEVKTKDVRRLVPGVARQLTFDGALEVIESTYRTKLVKVDKRMDLALIEILAPIPNTIAARFACEDPQRGEIAFVVGNPMGVLYSSVVSGIISSTQRTYGTVQFRDRGSYDRPLLQISSGMVGGNSGGSVYNSRGELIGVPSFGSPINEILGFAVPLADIRDFLKQYKELFAHCESVE